MIRLDFETRSRADITKCGAWRYSQDSSTEIMCMAYCIDDGPVQLWVPPQFDLPSDYEETRTNQILKEIALIEKRILKGITTQELGLEAIKELRELLGEDNKYHLPFSYTTKTPAFILNKDILNELGGLLEAHNASFEQAIWNNILVPRFGAYPTDPSMWRDSMAYAAAHNIPLSLEKGGVALGVNQQKNMDGRRVMLQLSQVRRPTQSNPKEWWEPVDAPEKFETLFSYCMDDVQCEKEIGLALDPLSEDEQKVWTLDQIINQRGINVDENLVHKCLSIIKEHELWGKKRVIALTDGDVSSVTLVAKLKEWVNSKGVVAPDMTAGTIEALLKRSDLPEDVREVLLIRQSLSKTSTKKLKAMLAAMSIGDKRIRNLLLYHGASTGRWAGRLLQVQNFPRGSIDDVEQACEDLLNLSLLQLREKYGDPMEVISSCLRSMIVPMKGYEFMVADYAAIEARIVMWFADEEDALTKFREGADLYKDMASYVFEVPVEEVTKEQRQIGKAIILGCGFGMGPPKFQATVQNSGTADVSLELATLAVKSYRKLYSGVPQFWYATEKAAIDAVLTVGVPQYTHKTFWTYDSVKKFLYCTLPSGRKLAYYDPLIKYYWVTKYIDMDDKFKYAKFATEEEAENYLLINEKLIKRVVQSPTTSPVLTHMGVNSVTKQWERQETYGGKLVENIVQGTARDCMVQGMFTVEEKNYLTTMTIHDEIVAQVLQGTGSTEEFELLLSQTPTWASGLPLKAEAWRGPRYKK